MANNISVSSVFLAASRLLQYPDQELMDELDEIRAELVKLGDKACFKPILDFIDFAGKTDELDLEELYVNTFDFKSNTNLYMSYYNMEEQRERGAVLIELKNKYEAAGYSLSDDELPDYLPLMLEFASAADPASAKTLLSDYRNVIEKIYEELSGSNNPYTHIFKAILKAMENRGINQECHTGFDEPTNRKAFGGADK